ncbi:MAG: hypothetical protein IJN88_03365 [Clostridia bacterium]|nr:hypothetical protein [Clostridia bacterium]
MKKILALALSLVMAFSLAAPAFAAVPEVDMEGISSSIGSISDDASAAVDAAGSICDNLKAEDYAAAIDSAFDFAAKLAKAIHTLVHTLADIFGFDCPFCDEDSVAGDGEDADNGNGDADTGADDEPLYETAGSVIGAEFADKAVAFAKPYPMNVDAAYVFTAPTKSIEITDIATYNVKTVVILEEGATTGKITFAADAIGNYFHQVEGFKLIINNSGAPVNVVVDGVLSWTNHTAIANIGDYIEGPYTLTVL